MSEERVERRQRPRGGRRPRRKVCAFCVDKVEHIDYKDGASAGDLKTQKSRRTVPMPAALRAILQPIRALPGAYIAHGERGDRRPLSKSTAERQWTELMDAAGLTTAAPDGNRYAASDIRHTRAATITPHALRHNYITMCWESGLDVYETMKLVGHASITTTMNIYTHLSESQMARTAQKLDTMFASTSVSCKKVAITPA